MGLDSGVADVGAVGTVRDDGGRDHPPEFAKGRIGRLRTGHGTGLGGVAEKQVGLLQGLAEGVAEDVDDERF